MDSVAHADLHSQDWPSQCSGGVLGITRIEVVRETFHSGRAWDGNLVIQSMVMGEYVCRVSLEEILDHHIVTSSHDSKLWACGNITRWHCYVAV